MQDRSLGYGRIQYPSDTVLLVSCCGGFLFGQLWFARCLRFLCSSCTSRTCIHLSHYWFRPLKWNQSIDTQSDTVLFAPPAPPPFDIFFFFELRSAIIMRGRGEGWTLFTEKISNEWRMKEKRRSTNIDYECKCEIGWVRDKEWNGEKCCLSDWIPK